MFMFNIALYFPRNVNRLIHALTHLRKQIVQLRRVGVIYFDEFENL